MGIYRYTLRAPTKVLGGKEVGQLKFAYKVHWGSWRDKICCALEAAGERAADKLNDRGVQLFVMGSWGEDQSIHWMERAPVGITEEFRAAPEVGKLCKDSRGRWYRLMYSVEQLLAKYHEIGVLNTDDGTKYYFTDRKADGSESGLQFPPDTNLYRVITNLRLMRARNGLY